MEMTFNHDGTDQSVRNPPWTRDELILALDLYFQMYPKVGDASHPDIVALSALLNILPIHARRPDASRFRNPTGVAMKLNNFRGIDPTYAGVGLEHGSKADKEVWSELAHDQQRLHAIATAIRAFAASPTKSPFTDADQEEITALEGEILLRQHRMHERSQSIVDKKKEQARLRDGTLHCEVCYFDFGEIYGELGRGFIECHHTVPLSELRPGQRTRFQDLALVCANCHRMLHRRGETRTLESLRAVLAASHVNGVRR